MRKGARPVIFKRWREMITDILKACWDRDPTQRPSFLEISLCLKQELIDCEAGQSSGGSTVQGNSYHGEELNEGPAGNNNGTGSQRPDSTSSIQRLDSSNQRLDCSERTTSEHK